MPDTKITALTAIGANPIIPATFPIPMVDLTDTSMAASGTTKKVTVNQILGAGGTATLASATITGALTIGGATSFPASVINTSGGNPVFTPTASTLFLYSGSSFLSIRNQANTQEIFNLTPAGVYTFGDGAGGTRMTLNATGLGVGVSPLYKLHAVVTSGAVGAFRASTAAIARLLVGNTVEDVELKVNANGDGQLTAGASKYLGLGSGGLNDRVILDTAGQVGIGVTPSALWNAAFKAIQIGSSNYFSIASQNTAASRGSLLWNAIGSGDEAFVYRSTGDAANRFMVGSGFFAWYTAAAGTAGNAITFTQAMTLDASGNLIVGTTSNTNASRVFSRGTATSSALALQGASGDVALAQLTVGKFDNNTTTSQIFVRFTINDNSGGSGQINANGASQAAFGTFSDSRLKKNIVSLPSQLANILSLRPVEFDYKDGSGHQIGFVAQEVQDVYSDAVSEQDGFLTVTGWSKTEARLVSAIKELAAKVQALEAKLA